MERILALDVGDKTVGLAISDELQIIVTTLNTIFRTSKLEDRDKLKEIIDKYGVKTLVVGLPKNMDGSLGPQAKKVKKYMDFMKKNLDDIEIVYVDERLTTVSATRVLIDTNVRRENRKKYVDSIAANYILRTYLDMQRGKNGE